MFWSEGVYNNIEFANNHVIANETATPRADGLFGFDPANDFSTVAFRSNIIEARGLERSLLRTDVSYGATIENKRFAWEPQDDATVCLCSVETGGYVGPESHRNKRLVSGQTTCTESERFAWQALEATASFGDVLLAASVATERRVLLAVTPKLIGATGTVAITLTDEAAPTIAVYDALGRRVLDLAMGPRAAGLHQIALDVSALPASTGSTWRPATRASPTA